MNALFLSNDMEMYGILPFFALAYSVPRVYDKRGIKDMVYVIYSACYSKTPSASSAGAIWAFYIVITPPLRSNDLSTTNHNRFHVYEGALDRINPFKKGFLPVVFAEGQSRLNSKL